MKKTNLIKRITAATLVAGTLATSSMVGTFAATTNAKPVKSVINSAINGKNWMSYLPNGANLATINIPATHDSGTTKIMSIGLLDVLKGLLKNESVLSGAAAGIVTALIMNITGGLNADLAPFAKDQNLTIKEQLDNGIRLLDMRVSNYSDKTDTTNRLEVSHGGFRCLDEDGNPLTINKVIKNAKDFVHVNPSETVVISVSNEHFPFDFKSKYGIVQALFDSLNSALCSYFDADTMKGIGGEKCKQLIQKLKDENKSDKDVIVVDGKKGYPTVGEARGKIILVQDKDCTTDDRQPSKNSGSYNANGKEKWENLTNGLFAKVKDQSYKKDNLLDKTTGVPQPYLFETSCTGGDGIYFLNAARVFLRDNGLGKLLDIFGLPLIDDEIISGGSAQSVYVNPRLMKADWQKGKYYGWIFMDFATPELIEKIYKTNAFDFDLAGKKLNYISDIRITYAQDFETAAQLLRSNGFKVLDVNFNEEAPDKTISGAIVNGRKVNGSFNIAVGYKTSENPLDAITDLVWTHRDIEQLPMDSATKEKLLGKDYKHVSTFNISLEGTDITSSEGMSNLNIGTAGKFINLYYTKNQTAGERLIDLVGVQGYNKTMTSPMDPDSEYDPADVEISEETIKEYFTDGYEMPRDVEGHTFSSNYGRGLVNDVYLFYNKAFNNSDYENLRFSLYDGVNAGQLFELR